MGKIPVKMKAVVYSLSPFEQKIMPGLWKDFTSKIHHKVSENWISASLLLGPLVGVHLFKKACFSAKKLNFFVGACMSKTSRKKRRCITGSEGMFGVKLLYLRSIVSVFDEEITFVVIL